MQSRRWVLQFENLQIELVGSIGFIAEAVLGGNGENGRCGHTHIEKCHLLLIPKLSSGPKDNLDQKLTSKGYRCVANFRQTGLALI